MKSRIIGLVSLTLLFGCDSTTVDQVISGCVGANISGNDESYCSCIGSAVKPSEDLIQFYKGLADIRDQVKDIGESVTKSTVKVTIQNHLQSKESICKSETDSKLNAMKNKVMAVSCTQFDDNGMVYMSEDPAVCGTTTSGAMMGSENDYLFFVDGCSYTTAPDNTKFHTLTLSVNNIGEKEVLLLGQTAEKTGVYAVSHDDAIKMAMQAPTPSPYETVDPGAQMREIRLSLVRDQGSFTFGELVQVDPQMGRSSKSKVVNVINHNRFDFLKAGQTLSAGEDILSKVAFLAPESENKSAFWAPNKGDIMVNLSGIPVSESLLAALYNDNYSEVSTLLDQKTRAVMSSSCEPDLSIQSEVDALDLL